MLERKVREAVATAVAELDATLGADAPPVEVEVPREKGHGDFATNAAMLLARTLKRPPRALAGELVPLLARRKDLFESVEIAGPGFINFRIARELLWGELQDLLVAGPAYGRSGAGGGESVQVEFVSANPTGPLNVVNARAAAFGGTLTRLLDAAGYAARSEFYVNDVGGQIDNLGASLIARIREAKGEGAAEIPEGGYRGEYVADLARSLGEEDSSPLLSGADAVPRAGRLAVDLLLAGQQQDLAAYGVTFDRWFRQHELYPDRIDRALAALTEKGWVEKRDEALWFRSTEFGDDQDRVLVRRNGEPTYFLADIAYHWDKHERGFRRVIDIWGPDHHGYIGRMQAGARALGFGEDWLEILIVQQVNLLSGGKQAKMSKRQGEFIRLSELLEEVGRDTATFFFLMRRAESHLDFDIDLAKEESDENPVYYVKYAHARIAGILRKAAEEGVGTEWKEADPALLTDPHELDLIKVLLGFPSLVAGAAREREPHRLTLYLREVAQAFHLFYHHCRVVGPDPKLSAARLALTRAARNVLANGLALMAIEAPDRM